MLRPIIVVGFAFGLLTATAGAADETYTLKLYKSKKGDKSENEKSDTGKSTFTLTAGGMKKSDESTDRSKEVYVEEILEKKPDDRRATKLTRTYSVAEKTEKDKTTKPVYAGKTVLIEKKGDKYEFSIDGKALKEDDAKELFNSFNKKDDEPDDQDFLPTDPVKVGQGWTVPADKSEKLFKALDDKMKADPKKSKIEGKLLKAYKKDGAQFGVIELTVTMFVTEIDLDGQVVKTSADSKMVLKAMIETCIDGTVEFEDGRLEVSLDISADIPTVGSFALKSTTTGVEKRRAVKK
jgi:hypothetical protein